MLYDVSDEWLAEHGISRELADAHGLKRYHAADPEDMKDEYRSGRSALPNPGQRGVMTRWVSQCDGLRIRHWEPPWMGLDPVITQIRPDNPILTGESSAHGAHSDLDFWRFHLARHPDHGGRKELTDKQVEELSLDELRAIASTPRIVDTPTGARELRGDREHLHWEKAKYLHAPGPREWEAHDHADMKPKARESHERKDHDDDRVDGVHEHRVKDKSVKYATRIDVSPLLSEADFEKADRFYLIIEGTIKMLAVQTWIRTTGENAVALSVPAVAQWGAPELSDIATRYMGDKLALIVADSDAHQNTEVMRQAIRCRRFLRRRGANAHILLPPELPGWDKVGADDALGKAEQSLHDFQVIHREPRLAGIQSLIHQTQGWQERSWRQLLGKNDLPRSKYERTKAPVAIELHTFRNRKQEGRLRNWDVLVALSEQADPESGLYSGSLRSLEGDLQMGHATALEAIREAEADGFVERQAGLLETTDSDYSFARDYIYRPEWRIHEDMRAEQTRERYGDFIDSTEGERWR